MWKNNSTCYYKLNINNEFKKFVLFDFDDTLVKKYTSEPLPEVFNRLKKFNKEQHNIIIFSNQKGVSNKKTTNTQVQKLMDNFDKVFNFSMSYFYSTVDDIYRKPNIGMYNLFEELVQEEKEVLFYCGDAAGRKDDFSISDLYFANNNKIAFRLPEFIFKYDPSQNNSIAKTFKKTVKNSIYKSDLWCNGFQINKRYIVPICIKALDFESSPVQVNLNNPFIEENEKYFVILVGPQGSGKSTLANIIAKQHGFNIINNDTAKTKAVLGKKFKSYYENPKAKGIIIDNTNPKKNTRDGWLSYIKDLNWKVVIIHIDIVKDVSIHCVKYRAFHGEPNIPLIAIHKYYKDLQPPTSSEGNVITLKGIIHNQKKYNHDLRFV